MVTTVEYPTERKARMTVQPIDLEFWEKGDTIVIRRDGRDREYAIVAKRYRWHGAPEGPAVEFDLRDTEFLIDELARTYPDAGILLRVILALLILAPFLFAIGFYFLTTTETKLAWIGFFVAQTPYVVFFACLFGAPLLGLSLERRVSGVVSSALGMTGGVLGFILAVAWRQAFIGDVPPTVWPGDHVRLANRFLHDANVWWATFSVYIPAVVVAFKVLNWKTLAEVVSSFKVKQ